MSKKQKFSKLILVKIYGRWMIYTSLLYIIYQIILYMLAKVDNPWPYTIFISVSPLIISILIVYSITKSIPLKLICDKYTYRFCILGAIILCMYKASPFFMQYIYDWVYNFIVISIIYIFLLYCYQEISAEKYL